MKIIKRTELQQMEAYLVESEKEMESRRRRVKSLADTVIKIGRNNKESQVWVDIQANNLKRMYEIKQTQDMAKEMLEYYRQHPEFIVD